MIFPEYNDDYLNVANHNDEDHNFHNEMQGDRRMQLFNEIFPQI